MAGCATSPTTGILSQPSSQNVAVLQSATFSVTGSGGDSLSYQWMKNGVAISGATATTYTTPRATMADNGAKFSVTVSNQSSSITSLDAILTVNPGVDVVTYHYENMRLGQNTKESELTDFRVIENGVIYTTWSSHCDVGAYTSWVIAYSATTLKQTSVLDLVPNGARGGIWMSAAGPAAAASGNIYLIIGNGDFDDTLEANGFPVAQNFENCYVKLSTTPQLAVADYFTPADTDAESQKDFDFGSGGAMLLPDLLDAAGHTKHLAVGAGKDVNLYVVDRDNMGKFNATGDQIYLELQGAITGINFSAPAYLNGTVYFGSTSDTLKAFPVQNATIPMTPGSQSLNKFPYSGTTPTVSANGSQNGIVWTIENGTTAHLRAYDAANVATQLYSSAAAANNRDQFAGNKYITPVVVNGRVYVGTPNSVVVFGPLP